MLIMRIIYMVIVSMDEHDNDYDNNGNNYE